jgi:hypothetical protein
MERPPYVAGVCLCGMFSLMGFVVCQEQFHLLNSGRGGMDGLDDLIGFLASGGFWLGCGAIAWHCLFKLIGRLFKNKS